MSEEQQSPWRKAAEEAAHLELCLERGKDFWPGYTSLRAALLGFYPSKGLGKDGALSCPNGEALEYAARQLRAFRYAGADVYAHYSGTMYACIIRSLSRGVTFAVIGFKKRIEDES